MQRTRTTRLAPFLFLLAGPALTQEGWPAPPDRWWEQVRPGDKATFEVRRGPLVLRKVVLVTRVTGSEVKVVTTLLEGERELSRDVATVDARDSEVVRPGLPESARVTEVGRDTVQIDGHDHACTVYRIELDGAVLQAWRSPDLPPLFAGGNVKLTGQAGDVESQQVLLSYERGP